MLDSKISINQCVYGVPTSLEYQRVFKSILPKNVVPHGPYQSQTKPSNFSPVASHILPFPYLKMGWRSPVRPRSYGVGYHDSARRSAAETQRLGKSSVSWCFHWRFPTGVCPKKSWFIMEHPNKHGWFGSTPILGNLPKMVTIFGCKSTHLTWNELQLKAWTERAWKPEAFFGVDSGDRDPDNEGGMIWDTDWYVFL